MGVGYLANSIGLFRIVKTLYTTKLVHKLPITQTNAIRILISALWFAFVISACAAPAQSQAPAPIPAQVTQVQTTLVTPSAVPTPTSTSVVETLETPVFDGKNAYDEYLTAQVNLGPRPAGSKAVRATGDYIIRELEKTGWGVDTQEFEYRGVPIRNVIARIGEGKGPLVILGAHYDTRPRSNMDKEQPEAPTVGANDGASGVAVLLELARTLDTSGLKNEVWLAFFDAEDNGGLDACDLQVVEMQLELSSCDETKWGWSVGAEHVANNLPRMPEYVIVVDMIGDANQNIYYEHNSDKELQKELWTIADKLGFKQWFIPEYRWTMTDDHTPFLKRGIRAIDIIDFDYPPWHTTADTADKVSPESLERVGRVLETWLEQPR